MKVIDKKKLGNILLVDLETCDNDKTLFDFSARVVDTRTNKVLERISKVLVESWKTKTIINSCYSKNKKKHYKKMLLQEKYEFITRQELNDLLNKLIKKWHIFCASAYNGAFDLESLYRTLSIEKPRTKLFKHSILKTNKCLFLTLDLLDIGTLCYVYYMTQDFQEWYDKEIITRNKDNTRKVNVEVMSKYLLKDRFYIEQHTGQSDLDTEQQLLISALNNESLKNVVLNLPMLWGARYLATKPLKETTKTYKALFKGIVE